MCSKIFFPKFSFPNKVWFCPDIFSWFLFGQPLPIFVVLFFRKRADLRIACCFFILGLMLLWSGVQQNHPDEKSVGDCPTLESNRGQQWLSRTGQIKNFQGSLLRTNFRSVYVSNLKRQFLYFQASFFPTMSTYIWRDFTTEKSKENYQIIIKNL